MKKKNDDPINNSEPTINLKVNPTYKKDHNISSSYQDISLDTIMNKKKRKTTSKNKKNKKDKKDALIKIINKFNNILIKEKYFIPWFNKSRYNITNKNNNYNYSKFNKRTISQNNKYNDDENEDDKDDYDYKTKAHSTQNKRKKTKPKKVNYLNNNNLKTTIIENELKNNDKKYYVIPINPKTKKKNKEKIIEDINTAINNVKYVNREMRSNSRKIIIKQEPLDINEEEKIINKSYTTNEIKFNSTELKNEDQFKKIRPKKQKLIQSPYNDFEFNKNEIKSDNSRENKKIEFKKIKNLKQNRNSRDFELNNDLDEESSALMEDPSEVQTIYNFKNNTRVNTPHQSKDARSNANDIIEEENDYYNSLLRESINNLTKNNLLLPYISKLSLYNNNAINKTLDVLNNCNAKLFRLINSEDYVKFLEKNQKIISAYQIYCLYCLFNKGKNFYKLKNKFNRWKKSIRIFNQNRISRHIKNNKGHCLGCNCYSQQYDKNYCYCKKANKNNICNCSCKKCYELLKKILIRHKFMKKINPMRYYLFLWYKNIYNKVRGINL